MLGLEIKPEGLNRTCVKSTQCWSHRFHDWWPANNAPPTVGQTAGKCWTIIARSSITLPPTGRQSYLFASNINRKFRNDLITLIHFNFSQGINWRSRLDRRRQFHEWKDCKRANQNCTWTGFSDSWLTFVITIAQSDEFDINAYLVNIRLPFEGTHISQDLCCGKFNRLSWKDLLPWCNTQLPVKPTKNRHTPPTVWIFNFYTHFMRLATINSTATKFCQRVIGRKSRSWSADPSHSVHHWYCHILECWCTCHTL